MKNLLLTLVLLLAFSFVNAQKLTPKFLEGNWETEFHNVEFKIVNKKELKITIILKEINEPIDVLSYKIHEGALYMETYYAPNNWAAVGKVVFLNNDTMVEDVVSKHPGTLIYKRKLNN
jgi:hypothetical protein